MGLRKEIKLRTSFIEFVVVLGILIVSLVITNYVLFSLTSFVVYPANYSEKIIQDNLKYLEETDEVTADLLTSMSTFGVYSDNGKYIYGNFSDKNKKRMWDKYSIGKKSSGLRSYITSIEREEGILLIKYPLTMQYKTEKMRSILPNPEATAMVLFILELIMGIVLLSNKFAKKINKELESLLMAAVKIEEGDLEFNVAKGKIKELNILLQGINKMKDSLKSSLKEQWMFEQQKREQISALAHDVKTPLTIVRGNIELLKETELTEEQEIYCNYIEASSERMQRYIQTLLCVTRDELKYHSSDETIYITELLNSLKSQGESLSKAKNIDIIWQIDIEESLYIKGYKDELERALMNIISNAVGFSFKDSNISIINTMDANQLTIQITDQGKGFSKKMLKHGKEQYAMDDDSRTKNEQHGLGLYIANNIITKYNGELILSNSVDSGGVVTVKIATV
ncbi:MAG TPA: HAMP domain-containing histidine kinase [Epulopiscium sp.]|nr:HAMP domain-containing histidine kinase [Candidatus Epulonipiscium sp.]